MVTSIPLAESAGGDEIIWWKSDDGNYCIKRGYWLALEHYVQQAKEEEQGFQVWESIWKIKVPGVVKDFAWRGCKNIVPCKFNL